MSKLKIKVEEFDWISILVIMVVFNRIFVDLMFWWIIGGVVCKSFKIVKILDEC